MAVPSSGQLRLRADINQEINGNDSDSNVSLGTLSNDAGFGEPDTMSEFYGYSSIAAPTISYSSQSSNYTQITLNYTVNWEGHQSGTYKIECEIYSSASLGTNFYETVTVYDQSGTAPTGNQNIQFTITPTTQYAQNDFNYRLKVKATNQIATVYASGNSGGYRDASLQAATQYTWKTADQGSYRGWKFENNYGQNTGNGVIASGSNFRDQVEHPQLGWYTTHQTTYGTSATIYSGVVYVPNVNYNSTYNSYYTIADQAGGANNSVYHRNIYPDSISSGSRPKRRMQMTWIYNGFFIYNGLTNSIGMKHSNHGMNDIYPDYQNYQATVTAAVSPFLFANRSGETGFSGNTFTYNGTQHSMYVNTGGQSGGVSGTYKLQTEYYN